MFVIDETNDNQWQIELYYLIRMYLQKNNQITILQNYFCFKHTKGDVKVLNLSNYVVISNLSM